MTRNNGSDLLKGLIAGAVAGLAASLIMNQFQKLAGKLISDDEESHGAQSQQKGTPNWGAGKLLRNKGVDKPDDTAPERLANAAAIGLFDRELSEEEKDKAAIALHYAYGTSMAAVYGMAAEVVPSVTMGAGLPYGAAVWIGADEAVVPILGLSKSPAGYSLSTHAYALSSHLVYGAATEMIRRAVRNVL